MRYKVRLQELKSFLEGNLASGLFGLVGTILVVISLLLLVVQINQSNRSFIVAETREVLDVLYDDKANKTVRQHAFETLVELNEGAQLRGLEFDGLEIYADYFDVAHNVDFIDPVLTRVRLGPHAHIRFIGNGSVSGLSLHPAYGRSTNNTIEFISNEGFVLDNFQANFSSHGSRYVWNLYFFGVHLKNSDFKFAEICNLETLNSSFTNVSFENTTFGRCRFIEDVRYPAFLSSVRFHSSSFENTSFHGARLLAVDLSQAKGLIQEDFKGACIGNKASLPAGISVTDEC